MEKPIALVAARTIGFGMRGVLFPIAARPGSGRPSGNPGACHSKECVPE